jgi:two-component sensor histidine kinase
MDRQNEEYAILERIRRGDRVDHFETIRQRKDGSLISVSLTISPMRDAEGKVVGASKIARDITERKRSEVQMSALAREAEHRAKNLLANVKAMVQLSQADTPAALKRAIAGRIDALANVHSLFAQSRWTGAELRSLVERELSPYAQDGGRRIQIDGPPVVLKADVVQAVAVVLHELATNAAKYGALSVTTGQVRVEWSHVEDGQVVLRWTEVGGPPVSPPTRKGFGTSVLETMIRDGVKGRVQLYWHAQGLVCEIAVPMVMISTPTMSETNDVEKADRHVVQVHLIVDRQRRLVDRLIAQGQDASDAQSTLDLFTRILAVYEDHLRELRAARGYVQGSGHG